MTWYGTILFRNIPPRKSNRENMFERNIKVPRKSSGENPAIRIATGTSCVLIGANGSGKTRLAMSLENQLGDNAHRISAHRALTLNPLVPKISEIEAVRGLRYGYSGASSNLHHRHNHRWAEGKGATSLLADFDFLMQALFANQSRIALATHNDAHAGMLETPALTKFQELKQIWDDLLPHRTLVVEGDDIRVQERRTEPGPVNKSYSASEMSDGERAIFYLIGQALVAPERSVLIVDEPELHIHRAVQGILWDKIEAARKDCCFVYITHDFEFAANRNATKFVIQSFEGSVSSWDISIVDATEGFSEELTTLLLGNRHPVLFVEGTNSSLDIATYRAAYPGWTIVPRGSCEAVIHSVSTYRSSPQFNRIRCAGLVDSDGRNDVDRERLRQLDVHVLPVAEIENIFLLTDIAMEIAALEQYSKEEALKIISSVQAEAFEKLGTTEKVERASISYAIRQLDETLKRLAIEKPASIDALSNSFDESIAHINIRATAEWRKGQLTNAIEEKNISAFLSMMDDKGIMNITAKIKRVKKDAFESWLSRILGHPQGEVLVGKIRELLPAIH